MKRTGIVLLACLLLAAHHSRAGETGLVLMWLTAPLLLFVRQEWVRVVFPLLLLAGAVEWVVTTFEIWQVRQQRHEPALRMALILGGVATYTAVSALVFRSQAFLQRYASPAGLSDPAESSSTVSQVSAFGLTFALLAVVQWKMVQPTGILLQRFLPAGGWLQAFWLAVYAAWLTGKVAQPRQAQRWRPRVWRIFSAVFFLQLLLGLLGLEQFLMTGKLHLPVPALIAAGPVYREGGLFMLILFGVSLLLVGPAWCSWLCYIGAWDDMAARARRRPLALPGWRQHLRLVILVLVVAVAWILGRAGVPGAVAAWTAGLFGLVGVGVMVWFSRSSGAMVHCTAYCPIGWLATRAGKLSPFQVVIKEACNDCGACTTACRFDALNAKDIEQRKPAESCTLCGDCVGRCPGREIEYRFLGLAAPRARTLFLVMVVSLHAVFLGVARI
jgi:ferredoxin